MATTIDTPTTRTTGTPRVRMGSLRNAALIGGVFYVLTFAASIPALFLLGPVLNDPNYIVSAGSDTQVTLGAFLDLVTALTGIGTAVALFPVVRRQGEALALGFVTSRMFEAAVIVIGVVSVGQSLVAVRDWTFLLGPNVMAGLNALLLGTLLYKSGLVPRVIPMTGL